MIDWSILSGLDIALLAIIGGSAIVGVMIGLSGEVGRLLGFAGAIGAGYFSVRLWQRVADFLIRPEAASYWRGVMVIVGVVITAILAGWLVRTLAQRSVQVIVRQPADMILGLLFGVSRGVLVAIAFFFLASYVLEGESQHYVFQTTQLGKASLPAVEVLRDYAGTASRPMLDAWRELM